LASLLLAAQILFTLLAVTLGGVSLEQDFQGYAVLGATLFFLCNLALLCSVLCRTTLRAGIWSGVLAAILFVVLPIICATTTHRAIPPASAAWSEGPARGLLVNNHRRADLRILVKVFRHHPRQPHASVRRGVVRHIARVQPVAAGETHEKRHLCTLERTALGSRHLACVHITLHDIA
jgi:hypothetical protein